MRSSYKFSHDPESQTQITMFAEMHQTVGAENETKATVLIAFPDKSIKRFMLCFFSGSLAGFFYFLGRDSSLEMSVGCLVSRSSTIPCRVQIIQRILSR